MLTRSSYDLPADCDRPHKRLRGQSWVRDMSTLLWESGSVAARRSLRGSAHHAGNRSELGGGRSLARYSPAAPEGRGKRRQANAAQCQHCVAWLRQVCSDPSTPSSGIVSYRPATSVEVACLLVLRLGSLYPHSLSTLARFHYAAPTYSSTLQRFGSWGCAASDHGSNSRDLRFAFSKSRLL